MNFVFKFYPFSISIYMAFMYILFCIRNIHLCADCMLHIQSQVSFIWKVASINFPPTKKKKKVAWKIACLLRPKMYKTFYRIFSSEVRAGEMFLWLYHFCLYWKYLLGYSICLIEEKGSLTVCVPASLCCIFSSWEASPFSSQPVWILACGKHSNYVWKEVLAILWRLSFVLLAVQNVLNSDLSFFPTFVVLEM